ncbi:MAG TPA: cysteine-rich CWC family protein [Accumulibacter sp.]|nr:cysteine-rich CWC family protein [Accumulibacter sp.]HMW19284.1 cysteine-rich CWC family protein [Accumulibacter sp.]HMY05679.1 cysteine-rich CWC family protein [Accumulibacter sp.]HNC18722.1 cysteine-rich CWC family protein [Accumulibacter sp.]HND79939.1 cysteine-rich CWC family protein [Accumulibacter sp.]
MNDSRQSAAEPTPAQATQTACAACGTAFVCGAVAGLATCWCVTMPTMPATDLDVDRGCYCPACLQQRLSVAKEASAPPT